LSSIVLAIHVINDDIWLGAKLSYFVANPFAQAIIQMEK
jgi:hypothetical protein